MKKFISILVMCLFLLSCSQPQNFCGTKKQHKARKAKTGKMAPKMVNY